MIIARNGVQYYHAVLRPKRNEQRRKKADERRRKEADMGLHQTESPGAGGLPETCKGDGTGSTAATKRHYNAKSRQTFTYKGRTQTAAEWAEELGLTVRSFYSRIERDWEPERIFTATKRITKTREERMAYKSKWMREKRRESRTMEPRAEDDELWQAGGYRRVIERIKYTKHPCVVYLTENGDLGVLPQSHTSSLNSNCIVGVYDKKVTAEMIYEDLQEL